VRDAIRLSASAHSCEQSAMPSPAKNDDAQRSPAIRVVVVLGVAPPGQQRAAVPSGLLDVTLRGGHARKRGGGVDRHVEVRLPCGDGQA
jgi:hypothetical protein